MEYTSRVYVKFCDFDFFVNMLREAKIESDSQEASFLELIENPVKSFEFFSNGLFGDKEKMSFELGASMNEEELIDFCSVLAETVGENAFFLAETINISVDPYSYALYYFGDEVCSFETYNSSHMDIDISDVKKWLGKTRLGNLSEKEKTILDKMLRATHDS